MGWVIAILMFSLILSIKMLYFSVIESKQTKMKMMKLIENSKDVDELLDWKLKLKDKELLKTIDSQLNELQK